MSDKVKNKKPLKKKVVDKKMVKKKGVDKKPESKLKGLNKLQKMQINQMIKKSKS